MMALLDPPLSDEACDEPLAMGSEAFGFHPSFLNLRPLVGVWPETVDDTASNDH